MNHILLFQTANGWMCRWSGPHAANVVDLFDSDTLPAAFGVEAKAETVLAAITRLNPGCVVELAEAA